MQGCAHHCITPGGTRHHTAIHCNAHATSYSFLLASSLCLCNTSATNMQHAASHLQHICNTSATHLQHTATHCNALQHAATHIYFFQGPSLQPLAVSGSLLLCVSATHLQHICNTSATHLQHICNTSVTHLQHVCNTSATHLPHTQHAAIRCNKLRQAATSCNTLFFPQIRLYSLSQFLTCFFCVPQMQHNGG